MHKCFQPFITTRTSCAWFLLFNSLHFRPVMIVWNPLFNSLQPVPVPLLTFLSARVYAVRYFALAACYIGNHSVWTYQILPSWTPFPWQYLLMFPSKCEGGSYWSNWWGSMSGRAQHGLSNTIAISLINRFPKKLLTLLEVTVAFTNKYSNTQILKYRCQVTCHYL